jgi:hypothetical protein
MALQQFNCGFASNARSASASCAWPAPALAGCWVLGGTVIVGHCGAPAAARCDSLLAAGGWRLAAAGGWRLAVPRATELAVRSAAGGRRPSGPASRFAFGLWTAGVAPGAAAFAMNTAVLNNLPTSILHFFALRLAPPFNIQASRCCFVPLPLAAGGLNPATTEIALL